MKKILLAILSGVLLTISWPTYGFPIFLFFGFVPLLLAEYQLRTANMKKAKIFGLSFLSFFIWNIATTWWIYNSTALGMWIAVITNSLLMSTVILIYHGVAKKTTFTVSTLFLICLWMSFEYMHLHWEFSWPWLNLGNGFADFISWIQWYEYTGTFGGTLWVWILNISIFKSILLFQKYQEKTILYRAAVKNGLLIILPLSISLLIFYTYEEKGEDIELVVLQPNINPYTEKYNTTDQKIGALLHKLATEKITDSTDAVIAPETVFADNNKLKRFSYSIAKNTGQKIIENSKKTHFLGGISMYDRFRDPRRVHSQTNIIRENDFYDDYNSAFWVRPDGATELYHKTKLVVGVENFPYQSILKPIVGDAMIDLGGTVAKKTTQKEREVFFTKDSLGIAPIICYESIYGEFITGYVRNQANILAIITNDAWWGNTEGHRQHLAYAKLRAVETRRSIARSANTGISAFINQKGIVLDSLSYEKQGALRGVIKTNNEVTFYAKTGNFIPRIGLFLTLFIFLFSVTRRKKPLNI
ncbi:apolipoprotein N-acyltransferase [Aquimarina sp. TRL1]|uniref:apolipoprotein N-acyltransferase n=1 Tax=Aquimarina sp. (strain TRL1) TaxID=2736252 RepID=UPI0015885741|nr:apolipoprotein N-acyltransferase [Aquimarina sp. TRL1]QKX05742.1 apolipoprotein N-acyltransferase [Aquimarina sp. TRL1]